MLFLAVIAFVPVLFLTIGSLLSAPKHRGPVSVHFNGKVFQNPGGVKAKGFKDVFPMLLKQKRGPWPEITEAKKQPHPPERVTKGIQLTFVNHSTFLIQVDGLNILTDPVWSKRVSPFQWAGPKRMRPPGIEMDQLPPIDVLLLSHNHYDHLDLPTVKTLLTKHQPQIITPLGVGQFIQQQTGKTAVDMDWWDHFDFSDDLRISCVPAQHFSGRGILDRDATLWCGYMLQTKTGTIYFAGDSGYGPFFKTIGEKFPSIDLALLPIGAYRPIWFMSPIHTSPEEAVKIHLDIKSKQSVATHFGTFPLAYEGKEEPMADLQKALQEMNIPASEFWVLEEGEGRHYDVA
ncbi:MAG: MBL fold metallo-hydrolase [Saprospiraceae bacterium]